MVSPAFSTSATDIHGPAAEVHRFSFSSRVRCAGNRRNAPKTKVSSFHRGIVHEGLRFMARLRKIFAKRDRNNLPRILSRNPGPLTATKRGSCANSQLLTLPAGDAAPNLQAINPERRTKMSACAEPPFFCESRPPRVANQSEQRRLANHCGSFRAGFIALNEVICTGNQTGCH